MCSVAATPVMTGIIMSSVITSGRSCSHSSMRLLAVLGLPDHLEARVGRKHLDEALADREGVLDDQDANTRRHPSSSSMVASKRFWSNSLFTM